MITYLFSYENIVFWVEFTSFARTTDLLLSFEAICSWGVSIKYGELALIDRSCYEWFNKFSNSEFYVVDVAEGRKCMKTLNWKHYSRNTFATR